MCVCVCVCVCVWWLCAHLLEISSYWHCCTFWCFVFGPDQKKKAEWNEIKWNTSFLMPLLILEIWPFQILRVLTWEPHYYTIGHSNETQHKAVQTWILSMGTEPVEIWRWSHLSGSPWACTLRTTMQKCPCVFIIIRQIQLLETKVMRRAKMEHQILRCKQPIIKGCAKSFRNNLSTGKCGLPASAHTWRISIFTWGKAGAYAEVC